MKFRGQIVNLWGQKAAFPSRRGNKREPSQKKICPQSGKMSDLLCPRVLSEKEIQEGQNAPVAQQFKIEYATIDRESCKTYILQIA